MAARDDRLRLVRLCRKGKIDQVRVMLNEFQKLGTTGPGYDYGLDFCVAPYFRSALWEAAAKNYLDIVQLMAEKGATIDYADTEGRTPLHEAARYGYLELAQFLVEKGHGPDPQDNAGMTPLFCAAEAGRYEIVDLLVSKGVATNSIDKLGLTVHHYAAFSGFPDMANFLFYKGAYKNRQRMEEIPPGGDCMDAKKTAAFVTEMGAPEAGIGVSDTSRPV